MVKLSNDWNLALTIVRNNELEEILMKKAFLPPNLRPSSRNVLHATQQSIRTNKQNYFTYHDLVNQLHSCTDHYKRNTILEQLIPLHDIFADIEGGIYYYKFQQLNNI